MLKTINQYNFYTEEEWRDTRRSIILMFMEINPGVKKKEVVVKSIEDTKEGTISLMCANINGIEQFFTEFIDYRNENNDIVIKVLDKKKVL